MHSIVRFRLPRALGVAAAAALVLGARSSAAQAWFYPSFQIPTVVDRDYTFAVVGAGGADFLFQWREGMGRGAQLSLDAGLADPSGSSNTKVLIGGQYAKQLTTATTDMPLDILFTLGAGIAAGSGPDLLRVPVGVSIGHRFPLEGGMAITPYVHPRASVDVVTGTVGSGADRTKLSLGFDLGASLTLTRQLALRGSVIFSGGNSAASDAGVGVGLTYTPTGLR